MTDTWSERAEAYRQSDAHREGRDLELFAEAAHDPEDLAAGGSHGSDRHDERVDDDVLTADAVVLGARDDRARDLETHVRVLGDAGLVVRDRHDGGAVLRT